ncbi:hypothetical protein [Bacillus phage SBSphiJ3]|nr:hypothetical protein [Bacillus phage SBSphiJ3]
MFYFYILQMAFWGACVYLFIIDIIFKRGTILDYYGDAALLTLGFYLIWRLNPVFWELVEKFKNKWKRK